jgi:hypothetical protein
MTPAVPTRMRRVVAAMALTRISGAVLAWLALLWCSASQ